MYEIHQLSNGENLDNIDLSVLEEYAAKIRRKGYNETAPEVLILKTYFRSVNPNAEYNVRDLVRNASDLREHRQKGEATENIAQKVIDLQYAYYPIVETVFEDSDSDDNFEVNLDAEVKARIANPRILRDLEEMFGILIDNDFVLEHEEIFKSAASKLVSLLQEQKDYANKTDALCQKWFILATYNGFPYGGVFAFYNKHERGHDGKPFLFIQGILKYFLPTVAPEIQPGLKLPKLNSIIDNAVMELAQRLGVAYIYVQPIPGQKRIMLQHYGYKKIDCEDFRTQDECDWFMKSSIEPCVEIYESDNLGESLIYKAVK